MKKAWDDIKSFVTVIMTIGYFILTFAGKMTQEYQMIFDIIIAFYFGTQAEKMANKLTKGEDKK